MVGIFAVVLISSFSVAQPGKGQGTFNKTTRNGRAVRLYPNPSLNPHNFADLKRPTAILPSVNIEGEYVNKTPPVPRGPNNEIARKVRGMGGVAVRNFIWLNGSEFGMHQGFIVLPDTYDKVFYCDGNYSNPDCEAIDDKGPKPFYKERFGKTFVYVNHFSGAGGGDYTQQEFVLDLDNPLIEYYENALNDSSTGKTFTTNTTGAFYDIPQNSNIKVGRFNVTGMAWMDDSEIVDGISTGQNTKYQLVREHPWIKPSLSEKPIAFKGGRKYTSVSAYEYNGTHWVPNSTLTSGLATLPDTIIGGYSTNLVFHPVYNLTGNEIQYGILMNQSDAVGYRWNGTDWKLNSTPEQGLPDETGDHDFPEPTIDYNIRGMNNYSFITISYTPYGGSYSEVWYWNGTQWVHDNTLEAGLPNLDDVGYGYYAGADVENISGTWYLILDDWDGADIFAYYWNESQDTWIRDESMEGEISGDNYAAVAIGYNITHQEKHKAITGAGGYVYSAPDNPKADIGNNGDWEWTYSGVFLGSETVSNVSAFQSYLDSCGQTTCEVPLGFGASKSGSLIIDAINITYDYDASNSITTESLWTPTDVMTQGIPTYIDRYIYGRNVTVDTPANNITIRYINKSKYGKTTCQFNETKYSIVTYSGGDVCNISEANFSTSDVITSLIYWDDGMNDDLATNVSEERIKTNTTQEIDNATDEIKENVTKETDDVKENVTQELSNYWGGYTASDIYDKASAANETASYINSSRWGSYTYADTVQTLLGFRGEVTYPDGDNVQSGSYKMNIETLAGSNVWGNYTFNDTIHDGASNFVLGSTNTLELQPKKRYKLNYYICNSTSYCTGGGVIDGPFQTKFVA